jgi:fumarate reductase subunit C
LKQSLKPSMKPSTQAKLWYAQRISAMMLALCVLVHLLTILMAVKGGLSGAEILSRTRGSMLTIVFYGSFVLACAVHAPIGLMKIINEWTALPKNLVLIFCAAFALLLVLVGSAAVWGVYRG